MAPCSVLKHRDALFPARYGALGFVALPNVWISKSCSSVFAGDGLILIYTMVSNALDWFSNLPAIDLRI